MSFINNYKLYGDKSFWIRPYQMFFEAVEDIDEKGSPIKVKRFSIIGKVKPPKQYIEKLVKLIRDDKIEIKNTERNQEYIITNITTTDNQVRVQPYSMHSNISGYLTEYEMFRRMGKNSCIIDGRLEIWNCRREVEEDLKLKIEGYNDYDTDTLNGLMGPCSIDLAIANKGFLKTRFKMVALESVENVSNSKDLWKKVKVHTSKRGGKSYFYLLPGQTILTHTDKRIKIPNDCAGKIEIKSAYARLSLSVTFGDFCNPGYDGFFPLEITNHGAHVIKVHTNAIMVQLILIASPGPILVEYAQKATQRSHKGFDEGLPYTFWAEKSIKNRLFGGNSG